LRGARGVLRFLRQLQRLLSRGCLFSQPRRRFPHLRRFLRALGVSWPFRRSLYLLLHWHFPRCLPHRCLMFRGRGVASGRRDSQSSWLPLSFQRIRLLHR
jgi:hypothetical protein